MRGKPGLIRFGPKIPAPSSVGENMLHTRSNQPVHPAAGDPMTARTALLSFATLLGAAVLAPALGSALSLEDEDVKFTASATGGLNIYGEVEKMAVAESAGNVVFTVAAEDVDTGIKLRNKHMRGYLEAEKFPNITLAIPRAEVQLPEDGKQTSGTVRGQFTVHGVTKPAVVTYKIKKKKKLWKIDARFEYDIRDHGIETPSYLGISVDPVMPVTAKVEVEE